MTGYTGIDDATMTTRPQDGTEAGFEKACTEFVSSLSNLPEGEFFFVDLWRKGRLVFFLVPFKNLYTSLWEMEQKMATADELLGKLNKFLDKWEAKLDSRRCVIL
ncbi:uncharacterized protein [Oscarella lobularis]|uniref:uncharacterized protein n=1 Tax=Oscarella lobularis TaxID=121494 RepID=UPI0033140766